jgi:hypothetical protein
LIFSPNLSETFHFLRRIRRDIAVYVHRTPIKYPLFLPEFYKTWIFSNTKPHENSFIFCWPCILLWFLVNDQHDAQFFSMYFFSVLSTRFEQTRAHHQENQLYQYNIWYMSLCVGDRFVCRSESSFPTSKRNGHRQ